MIMCYVVTCVRVRRPCLNLGEGEGEREGGREGGRGGKRRGRQMQCFLEVFYH